MSEAGIISTERAIADTRRWLERAVIGLNLCPFARAVHARGQIHYAVSRSVSWNVLGEDLERELDDLHAADPVQRETTLFLVPDCLQEFFEFNAFLAHAQRVLAARGLEGEIQLAHFHPDYQFAGSTAEDAANCTNRSPYPTLHLLRELSVERAVRAFPQAEPIYEANMRTLRRLGPAGWTALEVGRS